MKGSAFLGSEAIRRSIWAKCLFLLISNGCQSESKVIDESVRGARRFVVANLGINQEITIGSGEEAHSSSAVALAAVCAEVAASWTRERSALPNAILGWPKTPRTQGLATSDMPGLLIGSVKLAHPRSLPFVAGFVESEGGNNDVFLELVAHVKLDSTSSIPLIRDAKWSGSVEIVATARNANGDVVWRGTSTTDAPAQATADDSLNVGLIKSSSISGQKTLGLALAALRPALLGLESRLAAVVGRPVPVDRQLAAVPQTKPVARSAVGPPRLISANTALALTDSLGRAWHDDVVLLAVSNKGTLGALQSALIVDAGDWGPADMQTGVSRQWVVEYLSPSARKAIQILVVDGKAEVGDAGSVGDNLSLPIQGTWISSERAADACLAEFRQSDRPTPAVVALGRLQHFRGESRPVWEITLNAAAGPGVVHACRVDAVDGKVLAEPAAQ